MSRSPNPPRPRQPRVENPKPGKQSAPVLRSTPRDVDKPVEATPHDAASTKGRRPPLPIPPTLPPPPPRRPGLQPSATPRTRQDAERPSDSSVRISVRVRYALSRSRKCHRATMHRRRMATGRDTGPSGDPRTETHFPRSGTDHA